MFLPRPSLRITPSSSTQPLVVSLLLVFFLLKPFLATQVSSEDLTCLRSEVDGNSQGITWYKQLQNEARIALEARNETLETLKTPSQIAEYQKRLRALMIEQLGGFPDRSPLHGRVLGQHLMEGYRIEKVTFESQEKHRVTANLYLPTGSGPFPAVLVSSGHSRTAKTADYNQRFGIILAQHGLAALCYDPIGQGERSQLLTPEGKPQVSGTTHEHFAVGTGSILVGRNTATYRIWDAIRAIDYLETRTEIDSKRIGMTGCSGGGTLTSYVMAIDDRIACAAPACYLTTFRHLIDSIGPQDAEQNIFSQIAIGIDQPDYVLMRAPKPTLISSTTSDFFDIQGSWVNLRQAKRIYARLGHSERVDLVEAEGTHGVQPENLAAIAQWMKRWLVGIDRSVPIQRWESFRIRSEVDLLCTEQGQVLTDPSERSVFDLNGAIAKSLDEERRKAESKNSDESFLRRVMKRAAIASLDHEIPLSKKAGKVVRESYHIDKLVIHPKSGIPLPALTFHPKDPSESAYLYLHDGGKEVDGGVGGPIEKLVQEGYVVVSVDLRGQGETSEGKPDAILGDWKTFSMAYLLGKSVVGAHAEDILSTVQWIANYQSEKPREVHVIANGRTCIAAAHAASIAPERFTTLTLRNAPPSWSTMAGSAKEYRWLTATVHGALRDYDWVDLPKRFLDKKIKYEP